MEVSREEFNMLCEKVKMTCGKVDSVLTDDIPHITERLAKIDGAQSTLKWVVGVGLTIIGTLIASGVV